MGQDRTQDDTPKVKTVKDFFPLLEVPSVLDDKFARLDPSKLRVMYY